MSTWAGIDFGKASFGDRQNYLNTWYFKKSERHMEMTTDPDVPTRYYYRSARETIARRLALDGYDLEALQNDFKNQLAQKIDACRDSISYGYSNAKKNAALLAALEKSTLAGWLERLKKIISEDLKPDLFSQSLDYGDPILSYMLASYNDIYFEDEYCMGEYHFPCTSEEMYAVALIEIQPSEPYFLLDATYMVDAGWADSFDDLIEYHSEHTTFYSTFSHALAATLQLGDLDPGNQALARLLYANVITVLESYLSDTLKKQVLAREAILRRFVRYYEPFKNTKIKSISDLYSVYDGIREHVTTELDQISFHNIPLVKRLFQDVLATSFPNTVPALIEAVAIRHDIIHRNGKTPKNDHVNVTMADVAGLAKLADSVVLHIDCQIKDGLLLRDDE